MFRHASSVQQPRAACSSSAAARPHAAAAARRPRAAGACGRSHSHWHHQAAPLPGPQHPACCRAHEQDGGGASSRPDGPEDPGTASDSANMLASLDKASMAAGRNGGALNANKLVLASDGDENTWRALDARVNKYPGQREFTAIGKGGDSFRDAMLSAVSSVVGSVHEECVSQRESRGGKWISVRIGPVWVTDGDQVRAVYAAMKQDSRLKYWI